MLPLLKPRGVLPLTLEDPGFYQLMETFLKTLFVQIEQYYDQQ